MSPEMTPETSADRSVASSFASIPPEIDPGRFLPTLDLPPRHWDLIFTCFEPLGLVTGGIGTYHRLLLNEFADTEKSVLILTRKINDGLFIAENVTFVFVDDLKPGKPFNFVGLEHEQFSLQCHFAFRSLTNTGHSFGFVEFSDYGGDGFYPLRARSAGIYDFECAAVRLHSPNVMLIEDNGGAHSRLDQFTRDKIDREMSVYEDCDVILYGGDAMRDRVLSLTEKFGLDVGAKSIKCPHPYPRHLFAATRDNFTYEANRNATIRAILDSNKFARPEELKSARFVGIFGRIEDRKGQFQLLWGALHDSAFVDYILTSDIHFLIAGRNVLDHIGNYRLNDLYQAIHARKLAGRFHFTGHVNQDTLGQFSHVVSGYIFPSVFENYPNALLEVLPGTKPVAISSHGCMPEITEGFRPITVFDPLNVDAAAIMGFLETLPAGEILPDAEELSYRVAVLENRQAHMMDYYLRPVANPTRKPAADIPESLGFVVPVYQEWRFLEQTLSSLTAASREGDKIVVVDDGSDLENRNEIARICERFGAELLIQTANTGPAAARLRGVSALDTDLIQFCDADDLLEPAGIRSARTAFARDASLSMLTGVMSCFQDANHCWVPRNGNIWTGIEAHFAHSGSMFRKDILQRALALSDRRLPLNEDWLCSLLVLALGGKCRMIPEITYHYRRFEGTRSTQNAQLTGQVHNSIIATVFENWNFCSAEQAARVRELLIMLISHGLSHKENAPPVLRAHSYPLRYQMLDSVFFRIVKNRRIANIMLWAKGKVVKRRG